MTVVWILLAVVVVGVALAAVIRARAQGTEGSLIMRTEDDLAVREHITEVGRLGTEDGRPSGTAVPEPTGPPPVAGSQWDETAGRWIHWDPEAGEWRPVPPEDGEPDPTAAGPA